MLKILHIISSISDGGIEKLLFDYYKELCNDVQFDIAANSIVNKQFASKFTDLGANIYTYTSLRRNPIKCTNDLLRIMNCQNYDIIQSHMANRIFIDLLAEKLINKHVKIISQSHSYNNPENIINRAIRIISTLITKIASDELYACGLDAAAWTWGNNTAPHIMKNAICVNNFRFNNNDRNSIRNELKISNDAYVICCIGRICKQKNQAFLVSVFEKLHHKFSNKSIYLLLVGKNDGTISLSEKKLNITDHVICTGSRDDISKILSAADCFALPSLYEGLPISVVEAICSGLPCLLSDRITREVRISPLISFIECNNACIWIDILSEEIKNGSLADRKKRSEAGIRSARSAGYDLHEAAKIELQHYYSILERE